MTDKLAQIEALARNEIGEPEYVPSGDVLALVEIARAAQRVTDADQPELAEWPATARGEAAFREMTSALEALAAAVARLKEGT